MVRMQSHAVNGQHLDYAHMLWVAVMKSCFEELAQRLVGVVSRWNEKSVAEL